MLLAERHVVLIIRLQFNGFFLSKVPYLQSPKRGNPHPDYFIFFFSSLPLDLSCCFVLF